MYEIDEETGETIFTHNPFSMPQGGMDALLGKDPTEVLAYQYDWYVMESNWHPAPLEIMTLIL